MDEDTRRCSPHQAVIASDFASQSDVSIVTQKQLKNEMSVDLVDAQDVLSLASPAEAMVASVAAGGSRDGQSSRVLKNQNMLRITSENEKCPSYSLGVNQFTDLTGEECEYVPWIQTPEREQVGHHIGTIPPRWWHSGSSTWLGLV